MSVIAPPDQPQAAGDVGPGPALVQRRNQVGKVSDPGEFHESSSPAGALRLRDVTEFLRRAGMGDITEEDVILSGMIDWREGGPNLWPAQGERAPDARDRPLFRPWP